MNVGRPVLFMALTGPITWPTRLGLHSGRWSVIACFQLHPDNQQH